MITNLEWQDWKQSKVTKQLLEALAKQVEEGKDYWARGGFQGPSMEQTSLVNAQAVGKTQGLLAVINMDYEQFVGLVADQSEEVEAVYGQ